MGYNFLSNIENFEDFNTPDKAYETVPIGQEILFIDSNGATQKASFLMVRASADNDLLIQLLPWGYGVYIPANELWSVDSMRDIEGIIVKKAFIPTTRQEATIGKIQWMIGYN